MMRRALAVGVPVTMMSGPHVLVCAPRGERRLAHSFAGRTSLTFGSAFPCTIARFERLMEEAAREHDTSIWLYAFGYFACYAPYSALTKAMSSGLFGSLGKVSGFALLR